jgi:GTPase Era involved in 16S rRNA processing
MDDMIKEYIDKLRRTKKICDAAIAVCNLPELHFDKSHVDKLEHEIGPLDKQLKRLERNEFVVAVVGLEKNGKSTFVNSWLKYDFLPSEDKRCTLSTTKLYSTTQNQHTVKVSVMTRELFEQNKANLQAIIDANQDNDKTHRAQADLNQIQQHQVSLSNIIENGVEDIVSDDFATIKDALQKYIADPKYAYAVESVEVHTPRILKKEGVVFYDVPGLNSGFEIHETESKEMLGDCDAVILIQDSSKPSPEASEQKLARFASEAEEHLPVKEKIFLFLNKCDGLAEKRVNENYQIASKDWEKRHGISSNRIYVGSALAYLLTEADYVDQKTQERHEQERDKILEGVCSSKGLSFTNENVIQASAIESLKQAIEKFIKEERIKLIQIRCDPAIRTISELAKKILNTANTRYPDRLDEAEQKYLEAWEIGFQRWVEGYLRNVYERINAKFSEELDSKGAEGKLYQVYTDLVSKQLDHVAVTEEKVQKFLDINKEPRLRPERANDQVRTQMSIEVSKALKELGEKLAKEIYEQLGRVLEAMKTELWGDLRVEDTLIESSEIFERKLKAGVDALLMRFSRPLIEATLVTPRGEVGRTDTLRKVSKDLNALTSYTNVSPKKENVDKENVDEESELTHERGGFFPKRNKKPNEAVDTLEKDDSQQQQIEPAKDLIAFIQKSGLGVNFSHTDKNLKMDEECSKLVKQEVIDDFNKMLEHLNHHVFYASGVTEFRAQEFRGLLDQFQENSPAWRGITKNAFNRKDPKLMTVLPTELKLTEFDQSPLKIIDQLRDVLH